MITDLSSSQLTTFLTDRHFIVLLVKIMVKVSSKVFTTLNQKKNGFVILNNA